MKPASPSLTPKPANGKAKAEPPALTDSQRADLGMFIHFVRKLTTPTVSTVGAANIIGCSRRTLMDYIGANLLPGYKLPAIERGKRRRAKNPQPALPAAEGEAVPDFHPQSRDARHHRIPALCPLLLVIRERLPGWEAAMRAHGELAQKLLIALLRFLSLTQLYALRGLVDNWIAQREHDYQIGAGKKFQLKGTAPDAARGEQLFFPMSDAGGLPGCDERRY